MSDWDKILENQLAKLSQGEKEYFYFLTAEEMVYFSTDGDEGFFESYWYQPEDENGFKRNNIRRYLNRPTIFNKWTVYPY